MSASGLAQVMEQDQRALDAFVKGDPEPVKKLFRAATTSPSPTPLARLPVVGTRSRRPWSMPLPNFERARPSASSASRSS